LDFYWGLLDLLYLNMNSLTELLKTETDIGKIKQSYEFWKAEGKQSLFIDISIAHSNKEALRVVLVAEGPEIFLKSYSR